MIDQSSLAQSRRRIRRNFFSFFVVGLPQLFCSQSVRGQAILSTSGSPFSLLPNGSLSSWTQQGNANWAIDAANNAVVANQGAGFLLSRIVLVDSEITIEYSVEHDSDASFGFRCTDPYLINTNNSYIVSLTNQSNGLYPPGSMVGLTKVRSNYSHAGWNTLTIKAIRNIFTVTINNSVVISNFIDNRFNRGHIAVILSSGSIKLRKLNVIIPGRW